MVNYGLIIVTNGEGAKHFAQGIRELRVTLVHLQVNFAEVRCSIHANFDKACIRAVLLAFLSAAALLGCKHVLPERPYRWPSHHLRPKMFILF